ncbi:MAG: T9SS type A sorting domain-containing protein [Flavobacteriales bacterium]|nr:T9SS type A sorting domain-containing protein [Flavobacteriales bacterium]
MKKLSLLLTVCMLACAVSVSEAQTSYTWNGSTSTDFATGANWTPNGVPGGGDNITIVSTSNDPVLDGDRTVNNFTLSTGGVLGLGGYALTVSSTAALGAATVSNGLLYMSGGSATISGTTLDCQVDMTSSVSVLTNAVFKKKTDLETTYTGQLYSGGNLYMDTVTITQNGPSYFYSGYTNPDTFLAPLTFNLENAGIALFAYNSTGSYFADKVVFNNHSGNATKGIAIVNQTGSTAHFAYDIEMNVSSGSGYIRFYQGMATHDGELLIGSEGYASGQLTLRGYGQSSSNTIDLSSMSGTSTLALGPSLTLEGDLIGPDQATTISSACHFKGVTELPSVTGWYSGSTFEKRTTLDVTGGNSISTGGNMFLDTVDITRSYAQYLYLGYGTPDTILGPCTLNLDAAGGISIAQSEAGTYFADQVVLNNRSGNTGKGFTIGAYSGGGVTFDRDIIMNVDSTSGYINFGEGTTVHNGLLRIGSEGYHSGLLTLKGYTQTANGSIDLSGMNHNSSLTIYGADVTADISYDHSGTVTLMNATFGGNVSMSSNSLSVSGNTFGGTTYMEKTGSGSNNLNGGNLFQGATTLENSTSGNYVYWGYNNPDTMLGDLTLINHSSYPLWMNYNTEGQYTGDIALDGDSLKVVRFGSTTSGYKAVFDGSTDQQLTISNSDLDVQFYRVEVNKSAGRLKVNSDITVSYELALTDGVVECQNDVVVTLKDGVEPTATDSSYVEGSVKKIGNDAYTFPVGRNGVYRPIGISAPSNTSDAFTAEYFESNSDYVYSHSSKAGSLDYLSTNEYWMLTRDAGSSTPTVTLSWDTITTCGMDSSLIGRHVAGWNGTQWDDLGNGGTTGDSNSGSVTTASVVTNFVAFVLESDSSITCSSLNLTRLSADTIQVLDTIVLTVNWEGFSNDIDFYVYADSLMKDGGNGFIPLSIPVTNGDTVYITPTASGVKKVYLQARRNQSVIKSVSTAMAVNPGVFYYNCDSSFTTCDFIRNGSFEDYQYYAITFDEIDRAAAWNHFGYGSGCGNLYSMCNVYSDRNQGTPDIFATNALNTIPPGASFDIPNNCYGSVMPPVSSGTSIDAYAGIFAYYGYQDPNYSEYLYQSLSDNLNIGQRYRFSSYFHLSPTSSDATSLGFALVDNIINYCQTNGDYLNLPTIPGSNYELHEVSAVPYANMDTVPELAEHEWVKWTHEFSAMDEWTRIIIGNFQTDNHPTHSEPFPTVLWSDSSGLSFHISYYYVDEVSLTAVPPVILAADTIHGCFGSAPIDSLCADSSGHGYHIYNWGSDNAVLDSMLQVLGMDTMQCIDIDTLFDYYAHPGPGIPDTLSIYVWVDGPNGCNPTDYVTIIMHRQKMDITSPFSMCDTDSAICISGIAENDSILWAFPTGTAYQVVDDTCFLVTDWNDASSGYIGVTSTDTLYGCSLNDSIFMVSCCQPDTGHMVFFDTTLTVTGSMTLSGALSVNGILYLDGGGTVTFSNADVAMGGFAQIILLNGTNLTVTDSSHLYPCDIWHNGIYGQDSSQFIMNGHSLIEGAVNAVSLRYSAYFNIDSAHFLNNYRHLATNFYPNYPYGYPVVKNTTMYCTDYLPSLADSLITERAVEIVNNADKWPLGPNVVIDSARIGIWLRNSSLTVLQDSIRNISHVDSNPWSGTGIYSNGIWSNQLSVTGTVFSDNVLGLYAKAHDEVTTESNVFTREFGGSYFSDNATVSASGNHHSYQWYGESSEMNDVIHIFNSHYDDNLFGILSRFDSDVKIHNDTINVLSSASDWAAYGIYVSNNVDWQWGTWGVDIYDNLITDANKGIKLENMSWARVRQNDVQVRKHTSEPSANMESRAIQATNSGAVWVSENHVHSSISSSDYGWWDTGIRYDYNALAKITCNESDSLHTAIVSGGPGASTYLIGNVMKGYHFRGIMTNVGFLGQQGSPTSPADNEWHDSFTHHTDTYNPTAAASSFYVRYSTSSNVWHPIPFSAQSNLSFPGASIDATASNPGATSQFDCDSVEYFRAIGYLQKIALDSIAFEGVDSVVTARLTKLQLFRSVEADSILQLDSILVAFRDTFELTDLGKLDRIARQLKMNISTSSTSKTLVDLGNVSPTDSIASLWKDVLEMAFGKWGDDDTTTTLSSSDSTLLWQIAALCPYRYGPSVYTSRTMLFSLDSMYLSLGNDCEIPGFADPSEKRDGSHDDSPPVSTSIVGDIQIDILPNPATDGWLTINVTGMTENDRLRLHLYSLEGRLIRTDNLVQSSTRVNVSTVTSGTYFVKVENAKSHESLWRGKIVLLNN